MKRFLLAAIAAASLATASAARADTYIEVMGGPTFDPDQTFGCKAVACTYALNTGFNVGGGVGTDLSGLLGPDWAVQGDVFYTDSEYTGYSNDLTTLSLMGDLIYNWHNSSSFTPYVGFGIGGVDDMYKNHVGTSASGWAFGWQALVGVDWAVFQDVSLFGEYRYQSASDTTISGSFPTRTNVSYSSNNISFGLKWHL
jgi:opacity protein-like surface antigen